ncbi:hypothetical protein ACHQM5_003562 [Ranunculus cassubicifolius]
MGNCLRHKSSNIVNANHEVDLYYKAKKSFYAEEKPLLEDDSKPLRSSAVVKIKITKKQLEAMLGSAEMEGLSIEDMVSQLINASEEDEAPLQQQPWKPALQSIPEVN